MGKGYKENIQRFKAAGFVPNMETMSLENPDTGEYFRVSDLQNNDIARLILKDIEKDDKDGL